MHPLSGGRLLIVTDDKGCLFYWNERDRKWLKAEGIANVSLYSVASDSGENLFLSTSGGIYKSETRGETWSRISDLHAAFMVFSMETDRVFVKVWGKGLFTTAEDSFSSNALSPAVGLPSAPVQALAAGKQGVAAAGFFGRGVYESRDGGETWRETNDGLANKYVLTLAIGNDGSMFAGTYGGGLFRKPDGGASWAPVKIEPSTGIIQCLALSDGGATAAGSRGEGVAVSTGSGSMSGASDALPEKASVQSLAFDSSGVLYAGIYGKGLYASSDSGRSWKPVPFAYLSHASRLAVGDGGFWCALVKGLGLIATTDFGESWFRPNLPFSPDKGLAMAIDGKNRLFVGSNGNGVFFSRDFGATWTGAQEGLPVDGVYALEADPAGELFAAAAQGDALFHYTDESGWRKIVASDEYGANYTCWNIRFYPGIGNVAYGYQDILIAGEESDRWDRSRFGQRYEALWMDIAGNVWTERMLSTFVLEEDGDWGIRKDAPSDRYSVFAKLGENLFAAVRMEGGVDLLRRTGKGFERLNRAFENAKILSLASDGDSTVLVGMENGVRASFDRFETWREIELRF